MYGLRASVKAEAHFFGTAGEQINGQEHCFPSETAAGSLRARAALPRKELDVQKRLAVVGIVALILLSMAAPAVAATRAVLAELFGATW